MSAARRETYAASMRSPDFLILRYLQPFLVEQMKQALRSGIAVLDVGCGEQPLRRQIEAAGARYTSVDVVQNRRGTVDVIAPIWNLPLPDQSFDLIVATEVLEHVADTSGAFREMSRLLKRGGRIVLTMPFAYPLHEEPHDYVRLTPSGVRWHARQHQLDVSELRTRGNELDTIALIWLNLFERMPRGRSLFVRKPFTMFRMILNACTNAAVLPLSRALDGLLPHKTYLSLQAVLAKPSTPSP